MDPCGSDDEIEGPAKGGASRLGLRAMIPGRLFRSKTRDPPRDAKEGGKEGREGGKGAEKSLPASNSPQAQVCCRAAQNGQAGNVHCCPNSVLPVCCSHSNAPILMLPFWCLAESKKSSK